MVADSPMIQSAFARPSAASARRSYRSSGFMDARSRRIASGVVAVDQNLSMCFEHPAHALTRRKMPSPSRSASQALTTRSTRGSPIHLTAFSSSASAPFSGLYSHLLGTMGSPSTFHSPQSSPA